MKVIKLPDFCNPNHSIVRKVIEDNCTCPFCGHVHESSEGFGGSLFLKNERLDHVISRVIGHGFKRYGIGKPWYKHLFDKPCYWFTLEFICSHCKGEWETDEYPLFNIQGYEVRDSSETIEI